MLDSEFILPRGSWTPKLLDVGLVQNPGCEGHVTLAN